MAGGSVWVGSDKPVRRENRHIQGRGVSLEHVRQDFAEYRCEFEAVTSQGCGNRCPARRVRSMRRLVVLEVLVSISAGAPAVGMPTANGLVDSRGARPPCGATIRQRRLSPPPSAMVMHPARAAASRAITYQPICPYSSIASTPSRSTNCTTSGGVGSPRRMATATAQPGSLKRFSCQEN